MIVAKTEVTAIAELVARIDERTRLMDEKLDGACEVLLGNGKPETGLVFRVKEHHARPHLHSMIKSKTFWALMLAVILFANVLVDLGSPLITVLAKFLGIPIS